MALKGKQIGRLLVVALAVAALFSLASCGGGGETSSSEPLTKTQFLRRANAICASEEDRKTKAMEKASKLGKKYLVGSRAELTQLVSEGILPLYVEMIGELAALEPPAKDAAQVRGIIDEYKARLKEAEADPGRQLTQDALFYANKKAWKYGLKECTL